MIPFPNTPSNWHSLEKILGDEFNVSGELLVEARAWQKNHGGLLGDALLAIGATSEEIIRKALAAQQGLRYFDSIELPVDSQIAMACGFKYLLSRVAVPLHSEENWLLLACADPNNIETRNDIAAISGKIVIPVVTLTSHIKKHLNEFFEGQAISEGGETVADTDELDTLAVSDLLEDNSDAPAIRFVNALLLKASREKASDIHVEPDRDGAGVRFRLDGVLKEVRRIPGKRAAAAITSRFKVMASLDIAEKRKPQDGRIHIRSAGREVDIRVSTLPTTHGERVVLRLLEKSAGLMNLETLGFSKETVAGLKDIVNVPHGIFLVTGPTGSGKTTSLYALLQELDRSKKNVITIEDPAEYELDGAGQIQVNPKAGITFASGLRSILRQDPDVVMVGEIRDTETARISVQAAMTGHLVLSTLHTNDAASALVRLVDIGVEPFLLASSLRGVLAQRLVRKLCMQCRKQNESPVLPPHILNAIGGSVPGIIYEPVGCEVCFHTGYSGRTVIHELLLVGDKVRETFLSGADAMAIGSAARKAGMNTILCDAIAKLRQGSTSLEEILRATSEDNSDGEF